MHNHTLNYFSCDDVTDVVNLLHCIMWYFDLINCIFCWNCKFEKVAESINAKMKNMQKYKINTYNE